MEEKNEIKIIFDEENNEVIFSTNVGKNFIDQHYNLSILSLQSFEEILLKKGKQLFNYYRRKILDQQD